MGINSLFSLTCSSIGFTCCF